MSDRDTQFAGFAHLLYEDFLQLAREDESDINEYLAPDYTERWRMKVERLIAQRAYDLVCHADQFMPGVEQVSDIEKWDDLPEM